MKVVGRIRIPFGEEIDKENAFLNFAPYQRIWLANKRKYLPY